MTAGPQAFFLPAPGGQRLCLYHPPAARSGHAPSAVLYVQPWADEMNKARRMAALQARALAAAGHAVLQIDLHGCGDSSGDFGDASWDGWLHDLQLAARWLQQRHGDAPLCWWALRAGALLAVQAAAQVAAPCRLLLWQPVLLGKTVLQQFLRLKAAAELQQGDAKATLDRARADLADGRSIDVAGYRLAPALADGLDRATLALPPHTTGVVWLETSTRTPATLLPASQDRIAAWRAAGHAVQADAVAGPAFWQTQEIEDAPALLQATLDALRHAPAEAVA